MLPYNRNLKPFSRQLRSNMTEAEQKLWARLRRKQVCGLQFYRQKPLAGYIVDFYCAAAQLVIELDGSQHLEPQAMEYDRQRTLALEKLGLRVLRFDNRQVLLEMEAVMAVVWNAISPCPLFGKEGVELSEGEGGIPAAVGAADTTSKAAASTDNPPLCKRGVRGDLQWGDEQ